MHTRPFYTLVLILAVLVSAGLVAQDEKTITGWSFGGVPAIAYNSDTGFTYGIIVNTYNYGDGSTYPEYLYSLYTEWSRTTKGSGVNKLFFDSKYLLPYDIRLTSELSYLTEQALPFYGFNGSNQIYNSTWEDDEDDGYVSRVYYRHERNNMKFTADFQRSVFMENIRGVVGFGFLNFDIGSVDVESLNDGKDEEDMLLVYTNPDSIGLYDQYVANGYINADEADGGSVNFLKFGVVYDTRDNEPNPMSGMWTEALLTTALEPLGSDFGYTALTFTHRQYFTIIPRDLSVTYRVGYQGVVGGDIPYFMLPYYQSTYKVEEGLGGSKSLRGIMKNRVVGNSVAFGNLEARWKFLRTVVLNQNLYLALNAFVDGGKVMEAYGNEAYEIAFGDDLTDDIHISYGAGLRIALNENFIIAVDYGMAADEQDGSSGLYIGLGYLY